MKCARFFTHLLTANSAPFTVIIHTYSFQYDRRMRCTRSPPPSARQLAAPQPSIGLPFVRVFGSPFRRAFGSWQLAIGSPCPKAPYSPSPGLVCQVQQSGLLPLGTKFALFPGAIASTQQSSCIPFSTAIASPLHQSIRLTMRKTSWLPFSSRAFGSP